MPQTLASVWGALAEIYGADGSTSGSTGIVGITGKAAPFVRWGDDRMSDRPILVGSIGPTRTTEGAFDAMIFPLDVHIFVEAGSTGKAEALADRVEAVTTQANLSSTSTARSSSVDVAPTLRGIDPLPELDEGRQRLVVRYECRWNR